jgi:hypothetical protein
MTHVHCGNLYVREMYGAFVHDHHPVPDSDRMMV